MSEMYAVEGWRTDEDDEYQSYAEAVARYKELLNQAEDAGWQVERGWASRDNLIAARLTRGNAVESFLEVIRLDFDDDK